MDVCTSQAGAVYSVTNNPPNTYVWTITGGTQVAGGNTNSITVDWGPTGTESAGVEVVEYNACTNSAPVFLPVTVHSVAPSAITGRASVAENSPVVPYSVSGLPGYLYTWIITGGTVASGQNTPNITVNWGSYGTGTISVVAELPGCNPAPAFNMSVNKYVIIESVASGNWTAPITWDCNCVPFPTDNVRINAHTVALSGGGDSEVNNLIIEIGGEIDGSGRNLLVHGDLTINGTYTGGSNKDLEVDGMDKIIDGIGTISEGILISIGNKTILLIEGL